MAYGVAHDIYEDRSWGFSANVNPLTGGVDATVERRDIHMSRYRHLATNESLDSDEAPRGQISNANSRLPYISQGTANVHQGNTTPELPWIAASRGEVPAGAVEGGHLYGEPLYVARAVHRGLDTIGKLQCSHGKGYIPYGHYEHAYSDYEVLTNPEGLDLHWVQTRGRNVPRGAIKGGFDIGGIPLYVGRVFYSPWIYGEEGYIPGKVNFQKGECFISVDGKEKCYKTFEVLVINS